MARRRYYPRSYKNYWDRRNKSSRKYAKRGKRRDYRRQSYTRSQLKRSKRKHWGRDKWTRGHHYDQLVTTKHADGTKVRGYVPYDRVANFDPRFAYPEKREWWEDLGELWGSRHRRKIENEQAKTGALHARLVYKQAQMDHRAYEQRYKTQMRRMNMVANARRNRAIASGFRTAGRGLAAGYGASAGYFRGKPGSRSMHPGGGSGMTGGSPSRFSTHVGGVAKGGRYAGRGIVGGARGVRRGLGATNTYFRGKEFAPFKGKNFAYGSSRDPSRFSEHMILGARGVRSFAGKVKGRQTQYGSGVYRVRDGRGGMKSVPRKSVRGSGLMGAYGGLANLFKGIPGGSDPSTRVSSPVDKVWTFLDGRKIRKGARPVSPLPGSSQGSSRSSLRSIFGLGGNKSGSSSGGGFFSKLFGG